VTAIDETIRSVSTLNFGLVGVGGVKTLTFIVTNKSYPHGSQDITVAISGSFTLGAGDASFTLATYNSTRTIEVTYSPLAVQVDNTTITFTTTATYPMANVAVLAEGGSCTYALPTIYNNPAGDMKIDLIVDPLVPALTIPTTVKVKTIGVLTELIDVQPGIVDVQNLDISLVEDYSVYPEGFWYHLIQGYPNYQVQFRFILNENGTDTYYFWGKVYREDVQWPEHYISTAEDDVIRTVELKLVSLVHSLKDIPATDALTQMVEVAVDHNNLVLRTYDTDVEDHYYLSLRWVISSIIAACFNQTNYEDMTTIRNSDIKMRITEAGLEADVALENALVLLSGRSGWKGFIQGESAQENNQYRWDNQFSNCFDLLSALAINFGWVIRYFYGKEDGTLDPNPTNNYHRLECITRGRVYAGFVIPEQGIIESTLHSDTQIKTKNIIVNDICETTLGDNSDSSQGKSYDASCGAAWAIQRAENETIATYKSPDLYSYNFSQTNVLAQPPQHVSFDLSIRMQFITNIRAGQEGHAPNYSVMASCYRALYYVQSETYLIDLRKIKYWDYLAGDWSVEEEFISGLMKYFNRRFSGSRKMFERTYGSLKFDDGSTVSQLNLKPMVRRQINDQIAVENYYATEVRKDFKGNKSTILWIEE
jgi:hypothetical protein